MSFRSKRHIPLMERFRGSYKVEENGCWIWTQYCSCGGSRPTITVKGKQVKAHRWVYETFVGEIPDGLYVCHHCDNPKCVNPDHLFVGTQDDNMKDMKSKGRANKPEGETNGRAVLTEDQVLWIRKVSRPRHKVYGPRPLAKKFGVTSTTIYDILNGKLWPHLLTKES